MAEITKIKPQKNKKRVNIYLGGKFAFGLDADNFLKAGLKVGQELSEKQVEDLVFKNEFQKLLNKVYRILSLRPRSEKEIKDYLIKKKARLTFRPRGKFGLRMELKQKGVNKKIIDKVIEQLVDELPLARKVVQKKLKTYKNLPREDFYQKMSAFLARRGFSWPVIKQVVDELLKKR